MEKRDILRINIIYILSILFLLSLILVFSYWKMINYNIEQEINIETKTRDAVLEKYNKTTYIENNIEEFYNFINKAKEFWNINVYVLKKDLSFLIQNNVKLNKLEFKNEKWKITWNATDYRSVDLLSTTLKEYSELYWMIEDVTIVNSSKVELTNIKFTISFKINKEKLIDKIYTTDMDDDWIEDYKVEDIDIWWVITQKKVINDECPFTPHNFVMIWKIIEQNPELRDFYPQYKNMSEEWYFSLNNNGCLEKWDFNILMKKN